MLSRILRRIGGRQPAETPHPDLYTPGPNVNWAPERPNESAEAAYVPVYGPGYGRWPLEVEPAAPANTDYFLDLLKPTLDPKATFPTVRRLETDATFGAEIVKRGAKYVLRFSKDSLEAPRVEAR